MMRIYTAAVFVFLLCACGQAQQPMATNTNVAVPPLVNFSGTLTDANGKPMNGTIGVTFLLYKDQQGGAPLWMETQNVQPDSRGHYIVMLGSTSSTGLPADIFVAGQAHWLGVQVVGQVEQPRVLLVSAPYALKAGDAQTLGGLPASAFVLAAPPSAADGFTSPTAVSAGASPAPPASSNVTTTGGTVNTLPLFTTATNIQSSAVTQTGNGTTAKIGIGTTTPAATLDIKGSSTVRGTLSLPALGTATATGGKNSNPQTFGTSVFNSTTSTAVPQTFEWQAEPVGNDTSTASSSLNLLFGSGTSKPTETGLHIGSNGQITFATGQTFPGTGTGNGTVTNIATGSGLTGGPITTTGTLAVDPTVVPLLSANNTFSGTQTINNTTVMTGNNTAGVLQVTNTVTTTKGPAIVGTTDSSAAAGIKGIVNNVQGTEAGVFGTTLSISGSGVLGQGPSVGVSGDTGGISTTGLANGFNAGVWGDTGVAAQSEFTGVLGTADDNHAGYFENNSGSDTSFFGATMVVDNDSSNKSSLVLVAQGFSTGDGCSIDVGGIISCNGVAINTLTGGSGARRVTLHAVNSPENWFEDFGSGTLSDGAATVTLDSTFAATINTTADYHVFLTPRGECEGLYVANVTPIGFEVRELHHGSSSVSFDYRIVAKRLGYEKDRLEDVTERYQQMEQQQQQRRAHMAQRRAVRLAVESHPAALPVATPILQHK